MPQPWLYSPLADDALILLPAFLVVLLVELWPAAFAGETTPWMWLLLVVGIDVAHVYSTIFRTYMDPEARRRHRTLLGLAPMICWLVGVMLYSGGALTFWRTLAYLAVFHFVRQQYGFLRLYSRMERLAAWERWVDGLAIYLATLYPLVYWHTHPRSFHWFLSGDFVPLAIPWLSQAVGALYVAVLALYAAKELRRWPRVNLPKHLILAGTALSWYAGIVRHNGDLAFTVTNVVAHGVPYMALIWIYQRKQYERQPSAYLRKWFRPRMAPAYLGLLLLLAYLEEALWDTLVWRDHTQFFAWLSMLGQVEDDGLMAMVVPLLAVPQATHYVLDGFLWRRQSSSYS
jgi:hypothetical protein